MKALISLGLLAALGCALSVDNLPPYESYAGHQVISIKTSAEQHEQALLNLTSDERLRGLDFWKEPNRIGEAVDLRVTPDHKPIIDAFLAEHGLEYEIKLQDLGYIIQQEKARLARRRVFRNGNQPSDLTLNEFHNLQEIFAYLSSVAKAFPRKASIFSIGKSHRGRDIRGLKIGNPGSNKKSAFIHGCLHSREWIGCATMLYIINELTQNAQQYQSLLDTLDIYIVPVANPDGYEVTWGNQRMWRKTVSGPYGAWQCYGVDPNRNFDFKFKTSGYSNSPCDETYAGPRPFSEVESKAIANFLDNHKSSLKAYVDVHSYSELFMYPYGYARTYPKNIASLRSVAERATNAINEVNGADFRQGTIVDIIYPASGSTVDYAKGVSGIPYTYALELRPNRNSPYGFIVDFSQIIPGARECWAGLQVVLSAAAGGR
ncbi:hypothetical protein QR680_003586 [Steinernema hermaphroditum]|uniref:Peptidase M14 domain-containing protein n=1 Tax=Steinernema hermaphroditum TaxID=289476 RepID=A0AA39HLW8_9BILA|nr:hypothetical protein QR680_003586 [Steinernema hermaphroditum]